MNETHATISTGRKLVVVAVVGLLVLALVAYAASRPSKTVAGNKLGLTSPAARPSVVATTPAAPAAARTSPYKNGSYTATGQYSSPGGRQSLSLTLTLRDGVVTAASLSPQASDKESAEYQERFASGYQAQVIGRQLDSLNLSRVSGSSLTSQGFNDAVSKIKSQAQD